MCRENPSLKPLPVSPSPPRAVHIQQVDLPGVIGSTHRPATWLMALRVMWSQCHYTPQVDPRDHPNVLTVQSSYALI